MEEEAEGTTAAKQRVLLVFGNRVGRDCRVSNQFTARAFKSVAHGNNPKHPVPPPYIVLLPLFLMAPSQDMPRVDHSNVSLHTEPRQLRVRLGKHRVYNTNRRASPTLVIRSRPCSFLLLMSTFDRRKRVSHFQYDFVSPRLLGLLIHQPVEIRPYPRHSSFLRRS